MSECLRDAVLVYIEGEYHEVFRHELEPLDELEALQKKAEALVVPSMKGGGCECGAKRGSTPDAEGKREEECLIGLMPGNWFASLCRMVACDGICWR